MDDDAKAGCAALFLAILVIGLGIAQLVLGGLWRTEFTYAPAGVGGADTAANVVEFTEKLNAPHWVWGLVQGKDPDIQQAVDKHLGEGKRLTRLVAITRHTFVDNLLMVGTLGIYSPTTVTIRGAVGTTGAAVPAPAAPPPAPPPGASPDTGR